MELLRKMNDMGRPRKFNKEEMTKTPPISVNEDIYNEFKDLLFRNRITFAEIIRSLIKDSIPILKESLEKKRIQDDTNIEIISKKLLTLNDLPRIKKKIDLN